MEDLTTKWDGSKWTGSGDHEDTEHLVLKEWEETHGTTPVPAVQTPP